MPTQLSVNHERLLRSGVRAAALTLLAVSSLALVGWAGDYHFLKSLCVPCVAMNPLTAILFLVAGTALWLRTPPWLRASGAILAVCGLARALAYLFDWPFVKDHLLFAESIAQLSEPFRNAMAPNAAVNFLLLGSAMALSDSRRPHAQLAVQILIGTAICVTLVALVGYSYGTLALYRVSTHMPMALNTTILFVVMCVGLLCLSSSRSVFCLAVSPSTGGRAVRLLLPVVITLPWLLGGMNLFGQSVGWFGARTGNSLLVVTVMVLFSTLVAWNARLLDQRDRQQDETRAALEQARTELELRVQERTEALQAVNARFATFMDRNPAVAFIKDENGRHLYVNRTFEQRFGLEASEWLGKTTFDLWPTEHSRQCMAHDSAVLESGTPIETEETVPTPDGQERRWMVFKFPLPDPRGQRLLGGLALDITERKELEQQLRQSQKLEAVGQLAGGIAHDFNNLLTVIGGYGEMMLAARGDQAMEQHLKQICEAARRASALTAQLLAFSRRQVLEPKVIQLRQVVEQLQPMLRRLIRENIQLSVTLSSAEKSIKADPGQLEQVIVNLAVNARDAMPKGGQLVIETRPTMVGASDARRYEGLSPGEYVRLSVKDTGCGMDAATQTRIFEPFFTTKAQGKGTGLGLATVYGIVKQSGGCISVASQPGKGSVFHIDLPICEETQRSSAGHPSCRRPTDGTETILLVEDEDHVRSVTKLMLERRGYHVLAARDPAEAKALCERHREDIRLLLTDVVMPVQNGPALAQELASRLPELRVLYMSGYTDEDEIGHGVLTRAFLQKPFTSDSLASKVRDVLDASIAPSQRALATPQ